jgi:hypothetical protein
MAASSLRLDNLQVASPCSAAWESMTGTECVRFCASCGLNVYNLSAMNRDEAEALIIQKEERLCVRFFRRDDGTIITRDCPIGLRALRWRIRAFIGFAATLLLLAFGLTGHSAPDGEKETWITQLEPIRKLLEWIHPAGKSPSNPREFMGKM